MLLMRASNVPLRTSTGISGPWAPVPEPSTDKPLPAGAFNVSVVKSPDCTQALDLSWSGNTLVMHGRDMSAPLRGKKAPYVAKSTDFGSTWSDETGDIITMAVNSGLWFGSDYYLTTSGEGVLLKRNFESPAAEYITSSMNQNVAAEEVVYL